MNYTISFETEKNGVHDLTTSIREKLVESGVTDGICIVYVPHTTAGICITSFWDPLGFDDIRHELNRIVPTRIDFYHQFDTPQDAAGHIKSILTGVSETIIVKDRELLLGSSQGVYFLEFDGPRNRKIHLKLIKD